MKVTKTVIFLSFLTLAAILATISLAVKTKAHNFAVQIQTNLTPEISGGDLYKNNCTKCHGANGEGGKGPNLISEKKQAKWKDSDEKLINKITNGGWGMPKYGKKLKREEIKAIADHVRTFKAESNKTNNNLNGNSSSN